jgi:sterol desaturase/sphingolipid hydroxylase (fatty acid hydroxylase superfamily)
MSDHALGLIRVAYYAGSFGVFAFLATWESGAPRVAHESSRLRHVLRNFAVLAVVIVVADIVVLGELMGVDDHRLTVSNGLLTALALPALAQFALGFLLADFFDYGFHRLLHRWRWLWLVHSMHHSDSQLDASTGARFHPIEVTLEVVLKASIFLGLGIPLWVEGARAVVLNPVNFYQHGNVDYPSWIERRLGWLLVTAEMHRIHHSPDRPETDSNYGAVFSFWDRIFGTYMAPSPGRGRSFGLHALAADTWQTVTGMLLTPLRARGLKSL